MSHTIGSMTIAFFFIFKFAANDDGAQALSTFYQLT